MARVVKVAAGVAERKGKAEKKVRTTNWGFKWLFKLILKYIFQQKSRKNIFQQNKNTKNKKYGK